MIPAISSPAMETPASVPMMMTSTLGGISGARLAPARIVPADSRAS